MSAETIQRIFRDRNILVTDIPGGKKVQFDESGLAGLAPLDQDVTIQCKFISSILCANPGLTNAQDAHKKRDDSSTAMHVNGTLQDLLDATSSGATSAMNVLDLPLGLSPVDVPPNFLDLATETFSAPFVKNIVDIQDASNSLSWGTASTKNALSWFHVDDEGFATSVRVLTGGKLWVLADKIRKDLRRDEMSSTEVFKTWNVRDIDGEQWTLEAVHLRPRSNL